MNQMLNWYIKETKNKNLIYDEIQVNIINQFDAFMDNYKHNNFLSQIFSLLKKYKLDKFGFYVYGEVGSGKSMLMNEFYLQFPEKQKTRIHFHEFMSNTHQELAELKDVKNPLATIAKNLKKQYKIIFLDEMHISDIATAMILKNLFESLFKEHIYIVTTSNYAPDGLYPDGLMRDRFIPAIKLFEAKLEIIGLNSHHDYRLTNSSINNLFIINSSDSHQRLDTLFNKFSHNIPSTNNDTIEIQHRNLSFVKKSSGIIWFNFDIICGYLRSQLDYLELAQHFSWFIIEGIRELAPQDLDIARRFTLLVDILYDEHKKLILSSSCTIDKIYTSGEFANEFTRTISRLTEMQTNEYLAKPPVNSVIET